ncbi:hypothetical protein ACIBCS_42235 [Streptomyces phaeochromogenes]|uniref:hypothetical protein n=1 Tax=Streptomyces phaeochromogenes TaxID=1923 RepID=UPI00340B9058
MLAGIAAVLTLITAAASTYVAVATYQDQRTASEEEEKKEIRDFVRRVTLKVESTDDHAPGWDKWTIVNRNLEVLEDVRLFSGITRNTTKAPMEISSAILGSMPPCSTWTVEWGTSIGEAKDDSTLFAQARFTSPDGEDWYASGSGGSELFHDEWPGMAAITPSSLSEQIEKPILGKAQFCK